MMAVAKRTLVLARASLWNWFDDSGSDMTSLDPSHLPFLGRRHEGRETGAALHRAAPPLRSDPRSALADADDDGDVLGHHRSARSRRRRQESKEQGLVPLPIPIPDLRFEQGYLLSLAPFLHVPDEPSVAQEEAPAPATDKEKREAVEEDTSFVQGEDAAKPSQSLYLNPRLQVEWRQVVYVTLRDQVFYPLVQGALWGTASLLLGKLWAYSRGRPVFSRSASPSQPAGKVVGETRGPWERMVGGVAGAVQTNAVLEG